MKHNYGTVPEGDEAIYMPFTVNYSSCLRGGLCKSPCTDREIWCPEICNLLKGSLEPIWFQKRSDKKYYRHSWDVEQQLTLDKKNGNTYWYDAIQKEMENSRISFKLLHHGDSPPVGFTEITCHLVFDFKLDMTCKATQVDTLQGGLYRFSNIYDLLVSGKKRPYSQRVLIAVLNDLEVFLSVIFKRCFWVHQQRKRFSLCWRWMEGLGSSCSCSSLTWSKEFSLSIQKPPGQHTGG